MMNIDIILAKALQGSWLQDDELAYLLDLSDGEQREKLFAAARTMRHRAFADKVFLYGFVYFSTFCRNQCRFCYYRKNNGESIRYRKTMTEILEIANALKESGVHLLDLTMGEDPWFLSCGREGHDRLVEIVAEVKKATGLPLMISPGVVPHEVLDELRDAGADWYACYQETHTIDLYNQLRVKQPYRERWQAKLHARDNGMLIEEGLLTGMGDTVNDLVHSLRSMQMLKADQVRTMTFVPQAGTPLADTVVKNNYHEVNLIAVMRLLFPDALIPASLDVEGINGLKERINAGANVVTSIIPPTAGLAGVAQSKQDIAEGYRTVAGVIPILAECGLQPATAEEYAIWVAERKQMKEAREPVTCQDAELDSKAVQTAWHKYSPLDRLDDFEAAEFESKQLGEKVAL